MKFQTITISLAKLALIAKAATWNLKAVSLMDPSYSLGVEYGNKVVKMNSEDFPVFTANINSGSSSTYKYVILNKSGTVIERENFSRIYSSQNANINEVYNRKNKNVSIKSLPQVYEPFYKSGTKEYKNFEDNQIYTVYAKCNETAYQDLKYEPLLENDSKNEGSSDCNVTFVTKTDVYKRTGKLQLIGFSSRKYKKLSWKIKLDSPILGRKSIKFRGNANDPTMMRDKVSSELYRALGVPTYSSAYARLMINNDIYGLYNLVDSVNDKWIAPIIYGDDNAHVGTLYKTYAGADLKYLDNGNVKSYKKKGAYEVDKADVNDTEANGNDFYRLIQFTKLFDQWNKNYGNIQSTVAVKSLESFFNLESLLRQMVIEALTFAYDNFWANSDNFAIYHDPAQNKFQIIPYDFDGTFYGRRSSDRFIKNYLDEINNCYKWADIARNNQDTYFFDALFKHTLIKNRYDQIMKDTLSQLFNVNRISPLIDSISSLIDEDIAWNFGLIDKLDSSIPGMVNHFTYQNFKDNSNYIEVDYKKGVNYDDAEFGLKKWVQLRGNQCQQYVDSLPIFKSTTTTTTTKKTTTTTIKTTTTTKKVTTTTKKTTTTTKKTTTTTKKTTTTTTTTKKTNTTTKKTTTTTVIKTTKTTSKKPTSTIKISDSDRCGPKYGRCKYKNDCCSSYGHCGTGDDFCKTGCQPEYGLCY